jgi:hypothetical protein
MAQQLYKIHSKLEIQIHFNITVKKHHNLIMDNNNENNYNNKTVSEIIWIRCP